MKNYRQINATVSPEAQALVQAPEHYMGFKKASAPRPARKIRLFPSKPMKFASAASAAATMAMMSMSTASTISIDFHGTTQTNTLLSTDIAGEVPATHWNPAFGNIESTGISVDAPTLAGAATVAWNSSGSANIMPNSLATSDHDMMEGYIYGMMSSTGPTPAQVRVNSINLVDLGWSSYDVYVYSDTSMNGHTVEIDLLTGPTYNHSEIVGPYYTGPTFNYEDSQVSTTGNYVKFTGLTDDFFTIHATPLPGADIAAINGIQIVGVVPEPSAALLGFLGMGLLFKRRR